MSIVLICFGRVMRLAGGLVFKPVLIIALSLAPLVSLAQDPSPMQAPVAAPSSTLTAIRAGHFLDVESGRTLLNQVILVADGRIQAVGSGLTVPQGVQVIDLSGMTVLPGLNDCHT